MTIAVIKKNSILFCAYDEYQRSSDLRTYRNKKGATQKIKDPSLTSKYCSEKNKENKHPIVSSA
jgi:hypothetical protein